MHELVSSILVAVVVFASTDLDNLVLLTMFFSDPGIRVRSVVFGEALGTGVLVLISVVSALLALKIPAAWISLLGVVPLFLGIRGLFRLRQRAEPDADATTAREQRIQAKTHSQVLAVALVTTAHGADNLGVYIPLFARTPGMIPLYAGVFLMMMACSLLIAHRLVRNRLLGDRIGRFGRFVIPFVLLGLGIHILWGARGLV